MPQNRRPTLRKTSETGAYFVAGTFLLPRCLGFWLWHRTMGSAFCHVNVSNQSWVPWSKNPVSNQSWVPWSENPCIIAGIEQKLKNRYVHWKIKISYIGWGIRSALWVTRAAGHPESVDSYRPCALVFLWEAGWNTQKYSDCLLLLFQQGCKVWHWRWHLLTIRSEQSFFCLYSGCQVQIDFHKLYKFFITYILIPVYSTWHLHSKWSCVAWL